MNQKKRKTSSTNTYHQDIKNLEQEKLASYKNLDFTMQAHDIWKMFLETNVDEKLVSEQEQILDQAAKQEWGKNTTVDVNRKERLVKVTNENGFFKILT